uniref:Uncharacterized protein n=1 Tax=Ciona savignyi TaxID=51511 RepID=H2ZN69_CIOSA
MCIGLLEPGDLGATTNSTGAKNGFCSNTCGRYQLLIFVINFVLRVLVLCMTYVPYGVFLMRSVRPTDKAVAIALKEIVGKLFGEIPGSILTGKLFDSCCQFWSKAESGGCQFYDLEVLRVRYFLVNIIPSAVAALSFVLSITFLKNKTRKPELPDIVISPASPATGGSIPTSGPSNFCDSNLP